MKLGIVRGACELMLDGVDDTARRSHVNHAPTIRLRNIAELCQQRRLARPARAGNAHEPSGGAHAFFDAVPKIINNPLASDKDRRFSASGRLKRVDYRALQCPHLPTVVVIVIIISIVQIVKVVRIVQLFNHAAVSRR